MKLEWTKITRPDDDPRYESQRIEVVRGIGKIQLQPETEVVRNKYKPVKFGKERGYSVHFYANESGASATISRPALRLPEAKRAARLWLDGKMFTTDDGRVHSVFDSGEKQIPLDPVTPVRYRKKAGDVALPKGKKVRFHRGSKPIAGQDLRARNTDKGWNQERGGKQPKTVAKANAPRIAFGRAVK